MPLTCPSALVHEWNVLQQRYEQYERHSPFATRTAFAFGAFSAMLAMVPILRRQEGIRALFQARSGERILRTKDFQWRQLDEAAGAYQVLSACLVKRKGTVGLIAEFLANALRSTVVLSYRVLLAELRCQALPG